VPALEFE
jgi:hypothetical protein